MKYVQTYMKCKMAGIGLRTLYHRQVVKTSRAFLITVIKKEKWTSPLPDLHVLRISMQAYWFCYT